MLPKISENFNWPKTATRAGLICCLSEVENLLLETMLRDCTFIWHVSGFFPLMLRQQGRACPAAAAVAGASPSLARALRTWGAARHDPAGHVLRPCSLGELTPIKTCFVERSGASDPLKSLEARMTIMV